jgi:hypothetical protein
MCDAPRRGRGRPAIYLKEEARLQKREQARLWAQRRVRQLPKAEADSDAPAWVIDAVPLAAPTVLAVPTVPAIVAVPAVPTAPTVPTAPPVPEREPPPVIVKDDDGLPNPFLDDWDDAGGSSSGNDDGGGHTADNSAGGHIDKDLY